MRNSLGSVFGHVLALNVAAFTLNAAQPGSIKWTFTTAGTAPIQSVAILSGTIFFNSGGPVSGEPGTGIPARPYEIHALSEQNGASLWKFSSMAKFDHNLIAAPDGSVIANQFRSVISLDAQTGILNWSWLTDSEVDETAVSSPLALLDRGLLHVLIRGPSGGYLVGLDLATGIRFSRESAYRSPVNLSADWDGTRYFVANNPILTTPATYILTAGSFAKEKWTTPLAAYAVVVGYGGTLFTGALDQNVYAIDSRTGAVIWKFAANGHVMSEPIVSDDGKVIFNSSDRNIYAVDSLTGAKHWSLQIAARFGSEGSPALAADGTVYTSAENKLYALQSATGKQLWMTELTGTLGSPSIGADGTVYVPSTDGKLYAVHGQSAAGLAVTPWPKYRQNVRNTGSSDRAYARLTTTILRQRTGETEILFSGVKTDVFRLEASSDLKVWNEISVVTNTTGRASFVDGIPVDTKFYRTRFHQP
jgi:outer membrane protein assembly factor BamB